MEKEERVVITTRIKHSVNKALDEAKWKLKKPKGHIIDEAIAEYLKRHCPEVYREFLDEKNGKGD